MSQYAHANGSARQRPWFATDGVPSVASTFTDSDSGKIKPQRKSVIVAACFLATFLAYVERTGFSVAFTAAAKEQQLDEAVKGTVLSSFFWGYAVSQVPGGWAAQRWGGRSVLLLSFALWSTASLLTPLAATRTWTIAMARVFVGVSQGLLIPSIHTVLAASIPPGQRATAVSLTTSGCPPVMPLVAPQGGHPRYHKLSKSRVGTPWRRLLLHPATWAIVVNNFTFHYAFYVVMNWLPTYFDSVLHTGLDAAGAAKMMPYIAMFAMSNAGGYAGDRLITRGLSVARSRKLVNTIGFLGAAGALTTMPLAKGVQQGIVATTATLGFCGFARGGFSVNHMDIAPKYAGIVMGVSNTAGTLAGVVGVAISGRLLQHAGGAIVRAGWQQAFGTAALLCIAGSSIFVMYARGDKIFGETDNFV